MTRNVALLFPGQGSQYVGMGKKISLPLNFEKLIGYDLLKIMNEGPEEELKLTANAQPAIVAHSLSLFSQAFSLIQEKKAQIRCVMGHSVGEYSALAACGFFTFDDAIRLVNARGKFMQEAVSPGKGKMFAILKADASLIEEACRQASSDNELVQPANYNEPAQIVISGHAPACERAVEIIKQRSPTPIRAVELQVSAPFHCKLMEPAALEMKNLLKTVKTGPLKYPYVANIDAQLYAVDTTSEVIINNFYQQIAGAVRWYQSFEKLPDDTLCLEVGPGKVLSGMIRRINPKLEVLALDSDNALNELKEKL